MTRDEAEALALTQPAATKVTLWDRLDVYKVGGKVFASCGEADGFTFKASRIAYAVLTDDGSARPAPGFVPGTGWLNMPLAEVDVDDARAWLENAHRLVAAGLPKAARKALGLA